MSVFDTDDMLDVTDSVCKQIMSASIGAISACSQLMGSVLESYKAAKGPLQKELMEIVKEHAIETFDLAVKRADRVGEALIVAYGRDEKHRNRVRKMMAHNNRHTTGANMWAELEAAWRESHEENPNLN